MERKDIDKKVKEIMETLGYDSKEAFFVCAFKGEGDKGITSCASGYLWGTVVGIACAIDKIAKTSNSTTDYVLEAIKHIIDDSKNAGETVPVAKGVQ